MIPSGLVAAVLAQVVSAAMGDIACQPDGMPVGATELREAIINIEWAPGGGDGAMPYVALLVPRDWLDEGAAILDLADTCGVNEKARWRTAAPDGSLSVTMLPGMGWTASYSPAQFSACPSQDVYDAAGYARQLLKEAAPEALEKSAESRDDIIAPFQEYLKTANEYGGRMAASAVELRFESRDGGGEPETGRLITAVITMTPHPAIPENETRATALPSLLVRSRGQAPDDALIEVIRASALANPNWLRVREEIFRSPGLLPDPLNPRSIRPREPFPARATGPAVMACGGLFSNIAVTHVWKAPDGRYFYAPALSAALEAAP